MAIAEPNFIDRDPAQITSEMIAQYEDASGKKLYPAQAERLLIDLFAYRENLVRIAIQEAAKQNLVAYSRAPMLDYLGSWWEFTVCLRSLQKRRCSFRSSVRIPAIS